VRKILDVRGRKVDNGTPGCKRVLPKPAADAVNDILKGVLAPGGFAEGSSLNRPAAGKTGTTNDNYSVWFDGYTPNLATAAMIAGVNTANQPAPITGKYIGGQYISFDAASGSGLAAPMWAQAMRGVQQWLPRETFKAPNRGRLGSAAVTVPALGGLSVANAQAQLRSLGLRPVVGPTVDSSFASGTVAYSSPGSGEQAVGGQTVSLAISDGTAYVAPTTPPPPSPNNPPAGPPANSPDDGDDGEGDGEGDGGGGDDGGDEGPQISEPGGPDGR
jgi:membrane peptidoglycan carboxypeptidase